MSLTVKNSVQMSQSQLNRSPSKQTFSFSRQPRFHQHKTNPYCDQLYEMPTTRSHRAAGIGYGKRAIANSKDITPSPNQYYQDQLSIQEDFKKKKGWTLGVSREKMEQFGILPKSKAQSPGPGSFMPKSTLTTVAYTIRSKSKNKEDEDKKSFPGPQIGAYDRLPQLTPNGKFYISTMHNFQRKIDHNQPVREQQIEQIERKSTSPGPGSYNIDAGMNPIGYYYASNLKSSGCRSFGKAVARNISVEANPNTGPGSYLLPSEFGIYESKYKAQERSRELEGKEGKK